MATNGYINFHGHKTTASPTWCDAVIHTSNVCSHVVEFTSGGDACAIYATAAGVSIVNSDDGLAVGYATLANISCIAYVASSGQLYIGVNGTGLYTLDLSSVNFQVANGNLNAGLSLDYTSSSTPALYSNDVVSVYAWAGTGGDWLAVACCDGAGTGNDRVTIVDINSTAAYDSALWCFAGNIKIKGLGGAQFYVGSGNLLNVVYNAESIDADNWWYDATVCGNFADNFTDNALVGWNLYGNSSGCTVTEQNTRLEMHAETATDGVTGFSRATRTGMISGDFTITQKVVITSDYDANLQVGQLCGNFLCLMFPYEASTEANWWIPSVILERKIYKGSPTGYNRLYATYQTESGAIADYISFTANTFWWQIVRSGSTITANCSSNGITYTPLKQFTDCATSPVVIQVISYTTDDGYDHEGYTDDLITSFTGTSTCYSNSLPKTAITDFALADNTSTAGTSTIALGYGYGAWIADTDESTPQSSECDGNVRGAYTTTTSSSVYDVLGGISNSVTAICLSDDAKAITSTAGAGELIVSTSDGMSVVDLTDDSLENYFTEDNEIGYGGILLDDDVNDIVWGSSVFIATNSGGMWATLNSDPPANGTTYVHNHNGDMVNISTDTPTEADYHHSELYRRAVVNGSGYQVLKNDGFGGLGAVVDFPWTATGKISYFDTTANDTDDQYIYKWIHKDNSGNASSGDPQSAYIDDPLVDTVSACDPDDFSTARTRTRAVVVNVSASSGSLTDVEDAVEWIKIKEGSGSSYDDVPYQRYESGKNYNFCLSSGTGVKTLWVRAYSQSYRYDATGASDKSCTIELV